MKMINHTFLITGNLALHNMVIKGLKDMGTKQGNEFDENYYYLKNIYKYKKGM